MPQKYRVTTEEGTYEVTVDDAAPAPVQRGGLMHPLTSVVAPELESARGALNAATEAPHGQPIMARSRTGALYPSEESTGALNAAKGAVRGAGSAAIDTAEGMTSPLGIVGGVAGATGRAVANSPASQGFLGRTLRMIGDFDLRKPFQSTVGKAGAALQDSAIASRDAAINAERYLPNSGGMAAVETPAAARQAVPYASPTTEGTMAPKPSFSAADVLKIQGLMKQGVSQDMAIKILRQAQQGITAIP